MLRALLSALVLGSASAAPADLRATGAAPRELAERVVVLVNQARSRARRCGSQAFPPAAPVALAEALSVAAQAHARDMATHRYFSHRGRDGREPRDRVRAAGYLARLTGENIAFGPESAEEVVSGWLASAGHCANLMDVRFRHMGLGFATGADARRTYWVQALGAPAD